MAEGSSVVLAKDRDKVTRNLLRTIGEIWHNVTILRPILFLIILLVISGILSPGFISLGNMRTLLITAAPLMLITVGESLVVLTGMIDLGVQSVLAAAGVLAAVMDLYSHLSAVEIVAIVVLFGAAIGLLNGILVTKFRIPSFIQTLGIYWAFRGVAMIISKGANIAPSGSASFNFSGFAGELFHSIPMMIVISVVVVIVVQWGVKSFAWGKSVYAVGGNEWAAKSAGIKVDRTKIVVFVISGVLAATAGIVMTSWLQEAYAFTASGYSLEAIAAVVVGGIPFTGGYGSVAGAALGAIVITLISDLVVLLGLSPEYNYIAVGAVLVIAGLQIAKQRIVK